MTPEQRSEARRWFNHYLFVLAASGALHPRDALHVTPDGMRRSIATRMALAYRDLNDESILEAGERSARTKLKRARENEARELLGRLAGTSEAHRGSLLRAAAELGHCEAPSEHLRAALLDETFLRIIQLKLVDDIATPPPNPTP